MVEYRQRRGVRPVQVVQYDQQRCASAPAEPAFDPQRLLKASRVAIGQIHGEVGKLAVGLAELSDQVGPGQQRCDPSRLRACRPRGVESSSLRLDHRGLSQRGLADPGLAADEHQPTHSLRGSRQPHVEVSSFAPPPNQRVHPACRHPRIVLHPARPRCTNCQQAQAA